MWPAKRARGQQASLFPEQPLSNKKKVLPPLQHQMRPTTAAAQTTARTTPSSLLRSERASADLSRCAGALHRPAACWHHCSPPRPPPSTPAPPAGLWLPWTWWTTQRSSSSSSCLLSSASSKYTHLERGVHRHSGPSAKSRSHAEAALRRTPEAGSPLYFLCNARLCAPLKACTHTHGHIHNKVCFFMRATCDGCAYLPVQRCPCEWIAGQGPASHSMK
mmetsp:Transcript_16908/g.46675  ORF Transcript_16908/g.46675 Transcript_16908/m.46675 type:complete len:219 (-) Transcript_16908:1211-1867(-)